jgi:hypothetical protein
MRGCLWAETWTLRSVREWKSSSWRQCFSASATGRIVGEDREMGGLEGQQAP